MSCVVKLLMLISLCDDGTEQYPSRRHGGAGAEFLGVLKSDTAAPVVRKLIEIHAIKYTGCEAFI